MTHQQIKNKVFRQIKTILKEKQKQNIEPVIVRLIELAQACRYPADEVRKAVRGLIRDGKLIYGQTLNDFYFKLKS